MDYARERPPALVACPLGPLVADAISVVPVHAHVTVDANTYGPTVGQRFATNFKLVSAGGGCARFLYGDSSFTLCV